MPEFKPLFEGTLGLHWVNTSTPAFRAEHFIINGPRDGRYRLLAGQLIDPILMNETDVEALRTAGTVDVTVVAAIEMNEKVAHDLYQLLGRHFERLEAALTPPEERPE